MGIGTTNFKHHFATKHQDGIGKQMEFIKLGLKQQLFTKLVTMKFRIARHTTDLNRIIDFYGRILGLKVLGEFKDHHGYSGVFMSVPGETWHLEFTVSDTAPIHQPDDDDLLVFYASSLEEFAAMKTRFVKNHVKQVKPPNPYWEKNGITFEDPDGFRVVISVVRIPHMVG